MPAPCCSCWGFALRGGEDRNDKAVVSGLLSVSGTLVLRSCELFAEVEVHVFCGFFFPPAVFPT